jgi:hypothetical protein
MKPLISNLIKTVLCALFLSSSLTCYPFDETKYTDVRALSMGQIKALGGTFKNPSSISFAKHAEVGASLYRRFEMKELTTRAGYVCLPNRFLNAAAQLSYFGYEDYNVTQVQTCASKRISSEAAFGIGLACQNEYSFLSEDNGTVFSADAGFCGNIGNNLKWGLLAENLLSTDEDVPLICSAGLEYALLDEAGMMIECSYDFRNDFSVSAAIEYIIAEQFIVRGGYNSGRNTPSIGLAYNNNRWKAETAFLLHPLLGVSSAVGVGFFF